jgi:NitT/TauT family transport system permease protein
MGTGLGRLCQYAALLVMALMCTGLITLLFRLRDRLLAWQKALVQW